MNDHHINFNKYYLLLLFIILPFAVNSQNLRFGVSFDPQLSWLKPDVKNITKEKSKLGLNAGLIMNYYFAENYAFSTGISINYSGGNIAYKDSVAFEFRNSTDNFPDGATVLYKLEYLNIPLEIRLKTNEIGYFVYYTHLGVTSHIGLNASIDIVEENIENAVVLNEINTFNLSYHIGAGLEYSLGGNTALILGFIYNNGFIDVTKKENDKVILSSMALKIGIMF